MSWNNTSSGLLEQRAFKIVGPSVDENASVGTVITTLSAVDPDSGDTKTYSIVGADTNFEIVGDELRVKATATLDYETTPSYSITLRVTDSGGLTRDELVTIQVIDTNEDPTLSLAPGGGTFYESDTGSVFIDSFASITDDDLGDYNGGQITSTISSNGTVNDRLFVKHEGTGLGEVEVVGTNIYIDSTLVATISGGVGAADPLVITFTSNADVSIAEKIAQRISFKNISDTPTENQRTIQMFVTDGDGGTSNIDTRGENVIAVNDAPVLDLDANDSVTAGIDYTNTWTQGGGSVLIADSDAVLTDVDTANLTSLTITLTNHWDGSDEVLSADISGTSIIASYNSTTGILTLSGADTVANYQQVLRTISYDNSHWAPYSETRVIEFVASDGTDTSLTATTNLTMATNFGVLLVTNTSDSIGGDTSSIDALIANDGGDGISLREAIMASNNSTNGTGPDVIRFDVTGAGPHIIQPLTDLPTITEAIIIDGTSEPDYSGVPNIILDGSVGSATNGLNITGDNSQILGVAIYGFNSDGIYITGSNNLIQNSYIGIEADGVTANGNGDDGINIVGVSASGNQIIDNLISGNSSRAIYLLNGASGNTIQGNLIGTDASGTATSASLANGDAMIVLYDAHNNQIGGVNAGEENVLADVGMTEGISIRVSSSGNIIQGNYIGTDVTGTIAMGTYNGIGISNTATGNIIGGTATGAGNTIAFNDGRGISVLSSGSNTILGNNIYSNASLGIDLNNDDVTTNDGGDVDTGANNLQNFPVITNANTNATDTITVIGTFNSNANTTYRLEFFSSATTDGSGHGEAENYLGFVTVTTDSFGDAIFNTPLVAVVASGNFITATATVDLGGGNYGSTSEFSQNVVAITSVAPVSDAGGPYNLLEGAGFTLDASASSDANGDTLSYSWDLNNDGTYGDVTGVSPTLTWAQLQSFGINDDGSYTINVQVDDGNGGVTTASTTIVVSNVAPNLIVSGAATAAGTGVYTLNLSEMDPGNDTITSWTINWGDGTITTYAGNPASVTHTYSNDTAGQTLDITASATDEDGTHFNANLLVPTYAGTDAVHVYDGSSADFIEVIAPAIDGLDDHVNIVTGPNGNYFISGLSSSNVLEYQSDGTFVGIFVSSNSGGLNGATGLTFGPDGNLYVTSYNTNEVLRYNGTTGTFMNAFVPANTAGISSPLGITFGPDGDLYVASRGANGILRFDGTTGTHDTSFVTNSVGDAEDITIGPDGNLYLASFGTGVLRFDITDGSFLNTFVAVGSDGLVSVAGIAFGPDGHLYVGDQDGDAVLRYDGTSGNYIDDYVPTGVGGLDGSAYLAFEADHQVTIVYSNTGPTIESTIGTQNLTEDFASYTIDLNAAFADVETTDANLVFSVAGNTNINVSIVNGIATITNTADWNGSENLTFTATDEGGLSINQVVAFNVSAVNDAPLATNLNIAETYIEDTALNLTDIVVSDVDSANVTVTLTLSDTSAGVLSTASSGLVTSTFGSGVWTAIGAIADVNILLAGVSFNPASNFTNNFTITTSVDDGIATQVTGSKSFSGTAVNDAPSGTNATLTAIEDTPLVFTASNFGFSDIEGHSLMAVEIITLPSALAGSLTLTGSGAVTAGQSISVSDISNGKLIFTATNADANGTGFANFTFKVQDNGGIANGGVNLDPTANTITIDVTAVNDTPTIESTINTQSLAEDFASYTIDLKAAFADVETTDANLVFSVSGNTNINVSIVSGIATITNTADWNGSENLTFTAADTGGLNVNQVVAFNVSATNDTAVIAGTDTGSVQEDVSAVANNISTTGTLTISDVDSGESSFQAATINGVYGSLTIDTAGNWTYTADNTQGAIQALDDGESLLDTITVSAFDGTPHNVVVTIDGTEDTSVIGGTTTGSVSEDGTLTSTGALTISDTDTSDPTSFVNVTPQASDNGYGTFEITGNSWTFILNNAHASVQGLDSGEALTDTYTFTAPDGESQQVSVIINGAEDIPLFDSTAIIVATEDTAYSYTIGTSDVDVETLTITATTLPGWLTFTDNGDGTATLTGTPLNGDVGNNSVVLNVSDGTLSSNQSFTIAVTNTNDAATITGADTGTVQEDVSAVANNISTSGTLLISDVDSGESSFQAATISGAYGALTIDAAGNWTYTADNTQTAIQALDDGESLLETITVSAFDGTPHNVVVTIDGTEDTSVIGGTTTGSVSEDGTLTSTGALTISDTDTSDPTTFVNVTPQASDNGYGTFEITGNSWTFVLNNAHASVQALDAGETLTDTYTFTAPDGVTQQVTVTINGAEDTPIFNSAAVITVPEDSVYSYAITTSDVDIETVSITASTLPVWLTLTDNGDGTATLSGTPTNAEVGNHSVVLSVNDGSVSSLQSFTIAVTNTNDAAHLVGDSIVLNGTFDTDLSDWTISDNVDWSSGEVRFGQVGGVNGSLSQTISTTIGETYFVTFNYGDRSPTTSQSMQIDVDGNSSLVNVELTSGIANNTLQPYTFTFVADSTITTITLADTSSSHSGVRGYLDNFAVRSDATPAAAIDYTENDLPVVINSSILINDLDDNLIEGATVQITGNYTNGEDLLNFTDQNNIVGTWDATSGTLTLIGGANLSDYSTALQSVSYGNTSETPDTSTRTISISITDGDASSNILTQDINVISVNDAATIAGTDTGTVQEDVTVLANNISTTGILTIVDADTGESSFQAATITGTYGSLTLDVAGNWTYTADNTQAALQALDAGESLTDTLTVSAFDGTTHNVLLTINGTDDLSVIGGTTTGSVTEDGTLTSTAALTITDTDTSDPTNFVNVTPQASDNGYGTFEITSNSWTFVLNNAHASVQALDAGETLTDTYTFTAPDGVSQQVTVTINGAEDTAVLGGTSTGIVSEDGSLIASNTLTITDTDTSDNPVTFNNVVSTIGGNGYGNFELTANTWTYTLNNTHASVQALDTGETLTDTYTFTASDGSTQLVTVTINGAEDIPVFDSTVIIVATEDSAYSYTITTSDVDVETLTITATTLPGWLTLTDNGDGTATLTGTPLNGDVGNNNVVLNVSDGTVSSNQSFTIAVGNTNDAAVIAGTDTGAVQEDVSVVANNISSTGTLTISDVDAGESSFQAATIAGTYGSLTLDTAGNWTYTADNTQAAIQTLDAGESLIDTLTVSAFDGTTHNVVLTINGTEDTSVIGGTTTGSVSEDGTLTSTGALTITDTDTSDPTNFVNVTPQASDNGYGTFEITGNSWTFVLNNAHASVQALDSGETLSDTYTFTAPDGVTQQVTVTINGAEDIPVFNSTAIIVATEDAAYSYTISTSDVDVETLTITATTQPGWLTLTDNGDGTATLTGTPLNGDVGNNNVVLNVSDGTVSSNQSFTIAVGNTNDDAVIAGTDTGAVQEDVSVVANIISTTGTLTISDVDTGESSFQAATIAGTYGSLTLDVAGNWTYTADNTQAAIQALDAGESLLDTITVSAFDGTPHNVVVTIDGTEDTSVIGGTTTGSVSEDGTLTSTGALTITDTDTYDNPVSFNDVVSTATTYGSFELTGNSWTYTLDNANATVQALDVTEAITDSYTFFASDGTSQTVTVTINGAEDIPVIDSTAIIVATEDAAYSYTISTSDVDVETLTITATTLPGWLTLTDNGDGTATLTGTPLNANVGNNNVVLNVSDGNVSSNQSFTITVTNTNDAAVIAGTDTGTVQEDVSAVANNISTTGTLTISDVDSGESTFQAATINGVYGSLTIDTAGNWTYTADNTQTAIQALDAGESLLDTITVSAFDGTPHNVVVTIDGTEDTSVISGTTTGSVSEDGTLTSTGALTISDTDTSDPTTFVNVTPQASDNGYGTFEITGNSWTFTLNNSHAAVQALDTGETLSDTYTFTAPDGVTQPVTVIINGAEDIPVFDSTAVTAVTENSAYSYTISTSDVDVETLAITATTLPTWLTFTDNGDGTATLTGTPSNAHIGTHNVVLNVSDGSVSSNQNFTITVTKNVTGSVPNILENPGFPSTSPTEETENKESTKLKSLLDNHQSEDVKKIVYAKKTSPTPDLLENNNDEDTNIEDDLVSDYRINPLNDSPNVLSKKDASKWIKSHLLTLNETELQSDKDLNFFQIGVAGENDALWDNIDLMRDQMNSDAELIEKQDLEVEFVAGATISITVGFVNWVLRGGALLSSLLSSASLFKRFDPLAVVFSNSKKDDKKAKTEIDEEQNDIEELFDKNIKK